VAGLHFQHQSAAGLAAVLTPSARGELEITDLNRAYLARGALTVERIGRGYAWLDARAPDGLLAAAVFVANLQSGQGFQIACLEEIAFGLAGDDGRAPTA
jgi:glucose-1-phosphate thymidylyltransferase